MPSLLLRLLSKSLTEDFPRGLGAHPWHPSSSMLNDWVGYPTDGQTTCRLLCHRQLAVRIQSGSLLVNFVPVLQWQVDVQRGCCHSEASQVAAPATNMTLLAGPPHCGRDCVVQMTAAAFLSLWPLTVATPGSSAGAQAPPAGSVQPEWAWIEVNFETFCLHWSS